MVATPLLTFVHFATGVFRKEDLALMALMVGADSPASTITHRLWRAQLRLVRDIAHRMPELAAMPLHAAPFVRGCHPHYGPGFAYDRAGTSGSVARSATLLDLAVHIIYITQMTTVVQLA